MKKQHEKLGVFDENAQVFNITLFNKKYSGKQTSVTQISGFYKRLAKNTGIPVSPHRFRHTMATKLGSYPNINIFALSNILSHTNIRVTQHYIEADLNPQRELIKILEKDLTNGNKYSE